MNRPQRSRPIGIWMLSLWGAGLVIETIGRAVLASMQQDLSGEWTFSLTWITAAVAGTFSLVMVLTLVGLVGQRRWARTLFLILLTIHYGWLLVKGLPFWGPLIGTPIGAPGQGWVTIVVLEAGLGLGFGWWYLNRRQVVDWFGVELPSGHRSRDKGTEEP